jgi:hypothetical protein
MKVKAYIYMAFDREPHGIISLFFVVRISG